MLTVNSLGKFQITDGNVVVGDEELRSNMLSKLLLYILSVLKMRLSRLM